MLIRLLFCLLLATGTVHAQDRVPLLNPAFSNAVEASLYKTFEELGQKGLKRALSEIDGVLVRNPNFRLGHMIRGDLLMAQSGSPVAFGDKQMLADASAPLRHEARVRMERYFDGPPLHFLPKSLVAFAPKQPYALLVDTDKHRLFVFRNQSGEPHLVADYYVSEGKKGIDKLREGDQKTPLGVYQVTSTVPKNKLSDLYGAGAFPISYPNEWDRLKGRNGSGIWLHGTPSDTYSRPPLASDGCVVLTNDDFESLTRYIDVGSTPVVITSRIEWQEPERWKLDKEDFESSFSQWRKDWESLDVERYLAHYSSRFVSGRQDYDSWTSRKRSVAAGKSHIKVAISDFSAFNFHGGNDSEPYMVVTFVQDYKSNNLNNKMKKRQYWAREDGLWKIVYETSAT
jgi:murein L,D-transpeptidase YafK